MSQRWQAQVLSLIQEEIDLRAVAGKAIRSLSGLDPRLFDANPDAHAQPLAGVLRRSYDAYETAARSAGRLAAKQPLVANWTIVYDIYSPTLRRFIEVDEKQHFSAPRLARIGTARGKERPLYPSYFWTHVLPKLRPVVDLDPPHRDEARAYRDGVRELVPLGYGLKSTIRLDEFTLREVPGTVATLIGRMIPR